MVIIITIISRKDYETAKYNFVNGFFKCNINTFINLINDLKYNNCVKATEKMFILVRFCVVIKLILLINAISNEIWCWIICSINNHITMSFGEVNVFYRLKTFISIIKLGKFMTVKLIFVSKIVWKFRESQISLIIKWKNDSTISQNNKLLAKVTSNCIIISWMRCALLCLSILITWWDITKWVTKKEKK